MRSIIREAGSFRQGDASCWLVPSNKSLKPDFFGGDATLFAPGVRVGDAKEFNLAVQDSAVAGYGLASGRNIGALASRNYEKPFTLTGDLEKVTISVKQ